MGSHSGSVGLERGTNAGPGAGGFCRTRPVRILAAGVKPHKPRFSQRVPFTESQPCMTLLREQPILMFLHQEIFFLLSQLYSVSEFFFWLEVSA